MFATEYRSSAEQVPLSAIATTRRSYGTVKEQPGRNQTFLLHTVASSDTLTNLALRYDVSKESIKRVNGLFADGDIWIRKELKIPTSGKDDDLPCTDKGAKEDGFNGEDSLNPRNESDNPSNFFRHFDVKINRDKTDAMRTIKRLERKQHQDSG